MKITNPELKVVRFASEDVIATSTYAILQNDGSYNIYNGAMVGTYDTDHAGWMVNLGDKIDNVSAEDFDAYSRNLLSTNPDIFSLYGIYDGTYTKGATYVELYGTYMEATAEPVTGAPTNPPPFPMP